jgi:nitroimidazol reductase NimA-like FMN-containing flavoprotein (pyridoxamine 5'-phosphate oxidase superfamily)
MTMNAQIPPAIDRAVRVLRQNRYFVLATSDRNGPWAAALAYVAAAPGRLYFVSRKSSRHASALRANPRVAGVIYDSTAATEDVESIQFSGHCLELENQQEETLLVLQRSARRDGGPIPTAEDVRSLCESEEQRVYRIAIEDAYVLDQTAWIERGEDAREPVDVDAVFASIESDFARDG